MIVWLASYPRSGNTFLRIILNSVFNIKTYSIYDDKFDIGADTITSELVGHEFLPEDFSIEEARKEKKVYYIKTHERYKEEIFEKDKVIYLVRDGRESTLSFTKQQNIFGKRNINIIDTIYGNTFIGAWGEHLASWKPKSRKNIFLIKFEKLVDNPSFYIEKISDFFNIKAIENKLPTFKELHEVNPKFFRTGKINSWEQELSEEEHIAFWLINYKQMTEFDYKYKIPSEIEDKNEFVVVKELINQNSYIINLLSKQKNEILRLKDQQLSEKQKIIANKNNELQEKQKIIANKNNELQEKQKIIANKNSKLQEKQKLIANKNSELQEKQKIIANKNNELKENEKQLHKMFETIEKNNKELSLKENIISRNKEIFKKHQGLMSGIEKFTQLSGLTQPLQKYKSINDIILEYKKCQMNKK